MAKSYNQKAKILYLEKILKESTQYRPVSMQEILAGLEAQGIRAERKSIYDDMETLRDFGMEVRYRRGRAGGYFLENGEEILKEEEQIKEVSAEQKATGKETAKKETVKKETSEKETAREEADVKEQAAERRRKVQSEKMVQEKALKKNETKKSVSTVKVSSPRISSNAKEIRLLCSNSVKKKILKTFGAGISCKEKGYDSFTVNIMVEQDKDFYGWLLSMGREVHILKPKKAAVAYRDYLKSIAKDYKGIDK